MSEGALSVDSIGASYETLAIWFLVTEFCSSKIRPSVSEARYLFAIANIKMPVVYHVNIKFRQNHDDN